MKKKKKKLMALSRKCRQCHLKFAITSKHPDKIFCSKYCREKNWRLNNPQRVRESSKKYLLSIPVLCRNCNGKVPTEKRRSGLVFCSDECRKERRSKRLKSWYIKTRKKFEKYKIECGCLRCGYDVCAASMDFHHTDPTKKERRIEGKHWHSQSKMMKEELKKCILVCKNCHYELHDIFKKSEKEYWLEIKKIKRKNNGR